MTSEEIKSQYSMRDILSLYGIHTNRSGFICCPVHREKTPSMKIYSTSYHCFACGASGDVIKFVQEYEGISFKDAFIKLGGTYEHESKNKSLLNKYRLEKKKEQAEKEAQKKIQDKKALIEEIQGLERLLKRIEGSEMWFDVKWKITKLDYKLDCMNGIFD